MKWTPIKESDAIDDDLREQITDLLKSNEWEYICSEEQDYNEVYALFSKLYWIYDIFDLDKFGDFYVVISAFAGYKYAFNDFQGMILIARRIYSVKESIETAVQTVT